MPGALPFPRPSLARPFRTRKIAQAVSARLAFVCYVPMNTGREYHLMVFTLKKAYARSVYDFKQHEEPLTLFYLISFQFLACFVFQTEV